METPQWIVVRLGGDYNWWLEQTSNEEEPTGEAVGILDPRQVRSLLEMLERHRKFGLRDADVQAAFAVLGLESEIAEDRLRLVATNESIFSPGIELFAMPLVENETGGPFANLLDRISAAHIRKLNATHHYVRDCTEYEMREELDALDADRYFVGESTHAFDEINEILEWSPAEWDDAER
jgi:hypothetical protein